jgi:hypothetical protein
MGSLLDKKKFGKGNVLHEEKSNDIGTRLEASPKKSCLLALQCVLAKPTAHIGAKFLKLQLMKLWLYMAICPQTAKQELTTLSGFKNHYSMNFFTQNL